MSRESWQNAIRAVLRPYKRPSKIAILGIGNELRGDDAAGLAVVHALKSRSDLLVIDAGTQPENHTSQLRYFHPDLVLLIDAAQMNLAPGAIRVLDLKALDGLSASTHTLPLTLVAQYIAEEFGCAVLLIGIQPANTDFEAPLSPTVQHAVEEISPALQSLHDWR